MLCRAYIIYSRRLEVCEEGEAGRGDPWTRDSDEFLNETLIIRMKADYEGLNG